ncbi:MAG: hypothetical protein AB1352_02320 [Patescibacteria group bacterium]
MSIVQKGVTTSLAILIVITLVFGAMVWGLWPRGKTFEQVTGWRLPWDKGGSEVKQTSEDTSAGFINIKERLQIEDWITKNKLNQYGDPADTIYAGGSPLMDEATGKTMTRYEYLLKMHPNRPWKK